MRVYKNVFLSFSILLLFHPYNIISIQIKKTGLTDYLKENGLPVLCYHHLSESKSNNPFVLTIKKFKEQVNWLKSDGYQSINLQQFDQYLNGKLDSLPSKPVLITFDDASMLAATEGANILNRNGFHAVYFVFKKTNSKHADKNTILKLLKNNNEIQNHTWSHPSLAELNETQQSEQIQKNSQYLKNTFGVHSKWLAYPFSSFNDKTIKYLRRKKFKGAFTMFPGAVFPGHDRYSLPRYMVLAHHKLLDFQKKIKIRALSILRSFPADGAYLKNNQRVRIKIKSGFDKNLMLVSLGDKFIGNNKPIKFKYNKDTGEITFASGFLNTKNLFISIYIYQGDEIYQANLAFYPLWLKPKNKY